MDNNKILKKMVKNILLEEEMLGLSFETQLHESAISFYGLNEHLNLSSQTDFFYDKGSKLNIYWDLDVDAKTSGIRSMIPVVRSIRGYFDWEVSLEELSPEDHEKLLKMGGEVGKYSITGEYEFKYDSIQSDFKVDISFGRDEFPISIYPSLIQIYFDSKTIDISF